jgi:hypothetical protein
MVMNASEKARIAGRKEAVKAGVAKGLTAKEARKRYYVQTRVGELTKAGKGPVTAEKRKQLREKFNSGDVSRRGFAAPKKRVSSSSSSSSSNGSNSSGSSSGSSSSKTVTQSKVRSATSNMKGVSGYKAGSSTKSARQFGPQLSASQMAERTKAFAEKKDEKKNGRSVGGKVYDFTRNELLGVDDFSRAGSNLSKGNYGKAALSAGAGALELGTTIASLFGIGLGAKAAMGAGKTAKLVKGSNVIKGTLVKKVPKALGTGPKALGTGPKALGTGPKALGTGAKSAVSKATRSATRNPAVTKPVVKKTVTKKTAVKKVSNKRIK